MIALLDTNILIASSSEGEKLPDLTGFEDLVVSSLSYSELRMGIAATTDLRRYRQREARLSQIVSVYGEGIAYDDAAATCYGTITIAIADRGGQPKARRMDRMIAATALVHGYALVTRNTKDFTDIADMVELVQR
ncbi:PIN domain-containing protein [Actinomycetes bacterium M1A6_2h]